MEQVPATCLPPREPATGRGSPSSSTQLMSQAEAARGRCGSWGQQSHPSQREAWTTPCRSALTGLQARLSFEQRRCVVTILTPWGCCAQQLVLPHGSEASSLEAAHSHACPTSCLSTPLCPAAWRHGLGPPRRDGGRVLGRSFIPLHQHLKRHVGSCQHSTGADLRREQDPPLSGASVVVQGLWEGRERGQVGADMDPPW